MLKRILALAFATLFVVTTSTACKSDSTITESEVSNSESNSGNSSASTKSNAGSVSSDDTAAVSNMSAVSNDGINTNTDSNSNTNTITNTITDLNGRSIKVMLFGGIETFTDSAEGIYADSFNEIASKYNCKFEIEEMPITDLISTVEQAALAGTAPFDAAMVEGYHVIPKMALSGQYLCLSDYYNFNDGVWNNSVMTGVGEYEGKRYALPIGLNGDKGIFYNKALLRKSNLADPWTYVENDTWNWDNFEAMAKALTIDSNNDSEPEQFGFASEAPFLEFILANGGQVIDTSSGHGDFKIGDEKSLTAIDYVLKLYEEQIIPTSSQYTSKGLENAFNAMKTGKVAMFPYASGYGPWLADQGGMDMADIGWVYFPKGPDASDYVAPVLSQQSMLMVLKNVENPSEVITVLQDAMAFWSPSHQSTKTVEQVREGLATQDIYLDFLVGNHLTMYKNLANKSACVGSLSYTSANDLITAMFNDIVSKKYTPSAGIDAYKSSIIQAIKDVETVE